MSAAAAVFRAQAAEVRRSRAVIIYAVALLGLTEALLTLGGGGTRAVVTLLNVVLGLVPVVSAVFAAIHVYAARDFLELLLVQPVRRRDLYVGLFAGLALPLAAAATLGVALPFLWHGGADVAPGLLVTLLAAAALLTICFTGIGVGVALRFDDRAQGIGAAVLTWLALTLGYDALILFVVSTWGDYPIETPLLVLSLANPVDAARIALLARLDAAALLGYTGAALGRLLGAAASGIATGAALAAWASCTPWLGWRAFRRKDF